ncbi:biotin-dependent carboxyltransferase family protein [Desulfoferula mesophila]|uniref:Urea amidolyase n=1 Tax=Desulfoferula mesophila TaxID=3058419 RepID=A0AAU9EN94_9BACT|nr:urea amidolyase [Desulfoferula mesophilus]
MTDNPPVTYLTVLRPGALSSVQDLGRPGYQRLGIAESGAMDTYSLVQANRLLGNPDGVAVLEMTLVGPKLRFEREGVFALTGSDLSAQLDDETLVPGRAHRAAAGQILRFGPRRNGMRAYLAVPGGFAAPLVLGSRSTYIYAGFGGPEGRALQKGDQLKCLADPACAAASPEPLPGNLRLPPDGPRVLRVIMGPHEDRFTSRGLETFLNSSFRVTTESNRMGYRLQGPPIEHSNGPIVVSEATPLGAIQVPGQGHPVLLLRERGTTGGYTKIACIVSADIDTICQVPPGGELTFKTVGLEQAQQAERDRWRALDAWRPPLKRGV